MNKACSRAFFLFLALIFLISSLVAIPTAAMEYSAGFVPIDSELISAPVVINVDGQFRVGTDPTSNEPVLAVVRNTLFPVFPLDFLNSSVLYYSSTSDYIDENSEFPYSSTVYYSDFTFDNLNDDPDNFYGTLSCDYSLDAEQVSLGCKISYSDFYAWSELKDGQFYHSEVTLSTDPGNFSDVSISITYSSAGSDDVHVFESSDIPFIWSGGEFDIDPSLWNGTSDYYYIHEVVIQSDGADVSTLYGRIEYFVDPDLRSFDLDAAAASSVDSANVATVLDFFTAIGDWFVEFVPDVLSLFWIPGSPVMPGQLTLFGVIALCGLGFGLVFFLVSFLTSLLRFKS